MAPPSGSNSLAISRSGVVLPEPLRPTSPTRWPGLTVASASASSTRAPMR